MGYYQHWMKEARLSSCKVQSEGEHSALEKFVDKLAFDLGREAPRMSHLNI